MKKSGESSAKTLEVQLLDKIKKLSFNRELRVLAERLKEEAVANIRATGEMCVEKQRLIDSLEVVSGPGENEVRVVSRGDYGKDLEFGTKKNAESPWLFPSFVTVEGSIDTCQHGTPHRAKREGKAASRVLMNSGPAVISSSSR